MERAMPSLPALRRGTLPLMPVNEPEAFLHVALLGMTLTITALLGYIATRERERDERVSASSR
jgi:hypothetical protein